MSQKVNLRSYRSFLPIFALFFLACSSMEENQPAYDFLNNQLADIPTTLQSMENGVEAEDLGELERRGPNPTFATFNAALGSTGLASVFAREELTVFAPTDAAFAELGLNPGNVRRQEGLTQILLYHVVAGSVLSSDLSDGFVTTLNGAGVEISLSEGAKVNDANIILTDKKARNGVIHGIDAVLLPPSENIVDIALANEDFSILVEALLAADLVETVASSNGITVFAPNNQAFANLLMEKGYADLEALVNDLGFDGLRDVLLYHVIPSVVFSSDLSSGDVGTLQGGTVEVNAGDGTLKDQDGRFANIIATDIQGVNGVIHVIDQVILP